MKVKFLKKKFRNLILLFFVFEILGTVPNFLGTVPKKNFRNAILLPPFIGHYPNKG